MNTIETTTVDASTYWATVLGDLTESQAVEAHGLSGLSHSELMSWLETCEATARAAGATLDDVGGLRWDAATMLAAVSETTFVVISSPVGDAFKYVASTAREAAELFAADEVSADDCDCTVLVNVFVAPVAIPWAAEWYKVQVDPAEPDCEDVDHSWQDGPVRGSGGGVTYTDTCAYCGCRRHVDTWGTDAFDGTQGHRIVRYLPAVSE
jgi:hypothetical protein